MGREGKQALTSLPTVPDKNYIRACWVRVGRGGRGINGQVAVSASGSGCACPTAFIAHCPGGEGGGEGGVEFAGRGVSLRLLYPVLVLLWVGGLRGVGVQGGLGEECILTSVAHGVRGTRPPHSRLQAPWVCEGPTVMVEQRGGAGAGGVRGHRHFKSGVFGGGRQRSLTRPAAAAPAPVHR